MSKLFILLAAGVVCTACNVVKPTTRSQAVAYIPANEAQGCQKLGTATVETVSKVLLSRNPKTVQNELITLAKNEAVILKGDSVVAETEINNGKQEFGVYRCRS